MKLLKLGALVLLASLTGCASLSGGGDQLDLAGKSAAEATDMIAEALTAKQYKVQRASDEALLVHYDGSDFMLHPKLSNKLDRLVVSKYFVLHPELAQSPELLLIVGQLNQGMDFAKFVLREEGRALEIRGAATFVDTLSIEELTAYMDWTNEGIRALRAQFPQVQPMAVEVPLTQ
ncbi:YbjN domain-containing protein [Ferrimonas marina]|uniref:Putative sensory transduction regulator n=1 Tax=Ferrimonas marina TaxID=299255 RepID=A0A1M5ZAR0_9GAMM|nr:YbjN domain-containing protein [Ferrimonas marina]SHI21228.1 Putative sensory transduction regulator [Ferrimonas marina]